MIRNNEEIILDFMTRKQIGILRHQENGDIVAIEFMSRKVLGYYRASTDTTVDFYGRQISKGNTVVSFIYEAWQKSPQNPNRK